MLTAVSEAEVCIYLAKAHLQPKAAGPGSALSGQMCIHSSQHATGCQPWLRPQESTCVPTLPSMPQATNPGSALRGQMCVHTSQHAMVEELSRINLFAVPDNGAIVSNPGSRREWIQGRETGSLY